MTGEWATRRAFVTTAAMAVGACVMPAAASLAAAQKANAAAAQRFRIGFQIFGWGRYFPAAWWKGCSEVAALGYPGVEGEYTIAEVYEGREEEFGERMRAARVVLAALYSTTDLERPREAWENTRKNMQAASFCRRFGSSVLVLGGTEAIERSAEAFRIYTAAANVLGRRLVETHGVKLAVHPHVGSLVESREDIARVMDGTDPRAFFLAPDTGHLAAAGCDVVEVFRAYGDRVVHAHLKDYRQPAAPGQRGGFAPLGTGNVDFPGIVALLEARRFDGWLDVELDGGRGGDPADAARLGRDYLTSRLGLQLDPVAPSSAARQGLGP